MVRWIIKFVIVFSVFQLEYVSTDLRKVSKEDLIPRGKRKTLYKSASINDEKGKSVLRLLETNFISNTQGNIQSQWRHKRELSGNNIKQFERIRTLRDTNSRKLQQQLESEDVDEKQLLQKRLEKQKGKETTESDNKLLQNKLDTKLSDRKGSEGGDKEQLLQQLEHKNKNFQDKEAHTVTNGRVEKSSDPCIAKPCLNGATCLRKRNKHPPFSCKCPLGYKGTLCNTVLSQCESQPCNGGHCVATDDGFVCNCNPGFTGTLCEIKPSMPNATVIVITKEEVFDGEVVGVLFIVFLVILVIHFYRVKRRREHMAKQYYEMLNKSDVPPPLPPGVIEVSNLLCNEFFCRCTKQSEAVEAYVKASKTKIEETSLNDKRSSHKSLKKTSSTDRTHSSHRKLSASPLNREPSGIRTSYVTLKRQDSVNSLVSNESQRLLPHVPSAHVPSAQRSLQQVLSAQLSKKASSRKWPYEDPSSALSIRPKRVSTMKLSSTSLQHTDIPPSSALPPPPPPMY